jgi:predicted transcriptional regulator
LEVLTPKVVATTPRRKSPTKKAAPKVNAVKTRPPKEQRAPGSETKREQVIAMLNRANGATLNELVEKFGWQRHTVRGLLSTLNSKGVIHVESEKNSKGQRVYKAAAA